MSDFQFLSAGVPQGAVLGPLFFLIYVNDLADNLLSITRLFADDTSIASSSSNLMDIEGILNHDLRCITLWAKQWLVSSPLIRIKRKLLFFQLLLYLNLV